MKKGTGRKFELQNYNLHHKIQSKTQVCSLITLEILPEKLPDISLPRQGSLKTLLSQLLNAIQFSQLRHNSHTLFSVC